MAVVPDARGRGVGGALLSACLDHARSRGWRALSLSVEDGNTAARALYERHGFRVTGRNGGSDTMVVDLARGRSAEPADGAGPGRDAAAGTPG